MSKQSGPNTTIFSQTYGTCWFNAALNIVVNSKRLEGVIKIKIGELIATLENSIAKNEWSKYLDFLSGNDIAQIQDRVPLDGDFKMYAFLKRMNQIYTSQQTNVITPISNTIISSFDIYPYEGNHPVIALSRIYEKLDISYKRFDASITLDRLKEALTGQSPYIVMFHKTFGFQPKDVKGSAIISDTEDVSSFIRTIEVNGQSYALESSCLKIRFNKRKFPRLLPIFYVYHAIAGMIPGDKAPIIIDSNQDVPFEYDWTKQTFYNKEESNIEFKQFRDWQQSAYQETDIDLLLECVCYIKENVEVIPQPVTFDAVEEIKRRCPTEPEAGEGAEEITAECMLHTNSLHANSLFHGDDMVWQPTPPPSDGAILLHDEYSVYATLIDGFFNAFAFFGSERTVTYVQDYVSASIQFEDDNSDFYFYLAKSIKSTESLRINNIFAIHCTPRTALFSCNATQTISKRNEKLNVVVMVSKGIVMKNDGDDNTTYEHILTYDIMICKDETHCQRIVRSTETEPFSFTIENAADMFVKRSSNEENKDKIESFGYTVDKEKETIIVRQKHKSPKYPTINVDVNIEGFKEKLFKFFDSMLADLEGEGTSEENVMVSILNARVIMMYGQLYCIYLMTWKNTKRQSTTHQKVKLLLVDKHDVVREPLVLCESAREYDSLADRIFTFGRSINVGQREEVPFPTDVDIEWTKPHEYVKALAAMSRYDFDKFDYDMNGPHVLVNLYPVIINENNLNESIKYYHDLLKPEPTLAVKQTGTEVNTKERDPIHIIFVAGLGCQNEEEQESDKQFIKGIVKPFLDDNEQNSFEYSCAKRLYRDQVVNVAKTLVGAKPSTKREYIESLFQKISTLMSHGKTVIVLGFSYGGSVVSRLAKIFTRKNIVQGQGFIPNLYMATFGSIYVPPTRETFKVNIVHYLLERDIALTCNKLNFDKIMSLTEPKKLKSAKVFPVSGSTIQLKTNSDHANVRFFRYVSSNQPKSFPLLTMFQYLKIKMRKKVTTKAVLPPSSAIDRRWDIHTSYDSCFKEYVESLIQKLGILEPVKHAYGGKRMKKGKKRSSLKKHKPPTVRVKSMKKRRAVLNS